MRLRRTAASVALFACAGLQACSGPYGPHGDKGLPPPPANLSYQTVYPPPDAHHRLKSQAEQKQLQNELLAKKPPRRAKRG